MRGEEFFKNRQGKLGYSPLLVMLPDFILSSTTFKLGFLSSVAVVFACAVFCASFYECCFGGFGGEFGGFGFQVFGPF